MRAVKPFALRASEQACRVAGVLAAFGDSHAVSAEDMAGALALVAYSLKTWHAIIDEGEADQSGVAALRLYEWLVQQPGWCTLTSAILGRGPACVRKKDKRDEALALLQANGLVLLLAEGKAIAVMGANA